MICGGDRITHRRVAEPVKGGGSVSVQADVCSDCGERYFDLAAMRKLEAAEPESRGRKRVVRSTLRTCITCGLRRVERRTVEVQLRGGKTVRDVEADVCTNCGERYFDMNAMDRIEAVRFARAAGLPPRRNHKASQP